MTPKSPRGTPQAGAPPLICDRETPARFLCYRHSVSVSGFVVYTDRELHLLFNDTQADWTPDGLRQIHTYKKAGLDIIDIRDLTQMGSDGD